MLHFNINQIKLIAFVVILGLLLASCRTQRVVKDRHQNTKYYNLIYGEHKRNLYDVFVPAQLEDSTLVLVIHGGGWRMGNKSHIRQAQRKLLQNGIASVSMNYPLANKKTNYTHQLDAVDQLVHQLKDSIGNRELALLGESSGSHISLLYAYRHPEFIAKVITFSAPTDLYSSDYTDKSFYHWYTKSAFSRAVGEKYAWKDSIPKSFKEASPISQVGDVPTLMIQGTWDLLVNQQQAKTLDRVLTQKEIPHKLVLIKGANHTPRFMPWWKNKIYNEVVNFIKNDSIK